MLGKKRNYFLLLNYNTKEKYLCSWWNNEPNFYGQKVHYVGVTNGLGGYRHMLSQGFVDIRNKNYILYLIGIFWKPYINICKFLKIKCDGK